MSDHEGPRTGAGTPPPRGRAPRPPALGIPLLLVALAAGATATSPSRAQERPDDARARAHARNEEGVRRFEAGDREGALGPFREAHRSAPDEPVYRLNLGRCLLALGDARRAERRFDDAARDYHEAGGLLPDDPAPPLRQGLALLEGDRPRDARGVLEDAARRVPEVALAHELLAAACYRLGDVARAIEGWARALALEPDNALVRRALERARKDERVEADLRVDLSAGPFTVKYDGAADEALGRQVVQVLREAHRDVGAWLGRFPRGEVAVVIYPGRSFREVTGAHAWVGGLFDGKIRVPAAGLAQAPPAEVRRVLTHEYTHALVRSVGGPRVPAWLHEGLAQVVEGRARADARRGLTRATAPGLAELGGSFAGEPDPARVRLRYAVACELVHELLGRGGAPLVAEVLDRLGRGEDLDAALRAVYGLDQEGLERAWRAGLP